MRRPLKPFVTEYKTPTRRSKDAIDSPGQASETRADVVSATHSFMPADDNSYEAAMRAADALFSDTPKHSTAVYETASEVFKPAPVEAPSRRILEAVDETPNDRFAELEAEHAPKRRGRKPGSKNKPKLAPIAIAAIEQSAAPARSPTFKPTPAAEEKRKPAEQYRPLAAHVPAPLPIVPPQPVKSQTMPVREPFSWVRTRLRPGEKWKLRIPKVAW